MKRALVTGICGQDGSYLAELLLAKGYEVHGIIRRSSSLNTGRIDHLYVDPHEPAGRLKLHYGDMLDAASLRAALEKSKPDEVYNLAAQSHVRVSFDQPSYTAEVAGLGALNLFEAVREMRAPIRVYQASSSEMFGGSPPPQDESTPFRPRSPYAIAKVMAHHAAQHYRERGLFVSCGILFNHESPRRGETFVTRKITRALGRIKYGLQDKLYLGNLMARRDWGHARDYVDAMWRMLQHDRADDFVVATGESHSVLGFLTHAAIAAKVDHEKHVAYDSAYNRPTEVDALCGNAAKAADALGWHPLLGFVDLVEEMVEHDLRLAQQERLIKQAA